MDVLSAIKFQDIFIAVLSAQDVETVLCELFKSAETRDRGEKLSGEASSDSKSYGRQLTVEELFKGESSILDKSILVSC